jgi:hypothetical protein
LSPLVLGTGLTGTIDLKELKTQKGDTAITLTSGKLCSNPFYLGNSKEISSYLQTIHPIYAGS